jgi:hypothetical protein
MGSALPVMASKPVAVMAMTELIPLMMYELTS